MKVIILEGTPEEIAQAFPQLQLANVGVKAHFESGSEEGSEVMRGAASTALAQAVLKRRPVGREMRIVLTKLFQAHPKRVLATELQKATRYTPAQFAGLMGAFGRRVSHTDGWVEGTWFFDQEWNYDEGCWAYRLPETVREALRKEGFV